MLATNILRYFNENTVSIQYFFLFIIIQNNTDQYSNCFILCSDQYNRQLINV